MISKAELAIQRRITDAYILADPEIVILYRSVHTPDGAGGTVKGTPTPLDPQEFRFIPQQDTAGETLMADGRQLQPEYVLMGTVESDMERLDEFELQGYRYRITGIDKQDYQIKGRVIRLG